MKKLIALFIFLLSPSAFAWSGFGEVTEVMSHNGRHLIYTTIADTPCGNTVNGQFWWPADDADAKDMLSIALAAMMGNKKVSLVYNVGTPDCQHGSAAKATHIRVKR